MSQSRARKPVRVGGETVPNARSSKMKASGDSCPSNHNQPKQNQSSRSKHNLPKSIRYDLENALVGLCDVWFEDIKPHLIRNKIKLHVDSNGATASGDYGRVPPATTGCSHLDPGAASDDPQQTSVNFAACSSTPLTASKAQCRRPLPAPRPPPSSTFHDRNSQNKNSKRKSSRRKRSRIKTRSSTPTSNWQVPRLCRTYSHLSSQVSLRTRMRSIHIASPMICPREEGCLLSIVPRCRTNTRNKHTQTEVSCITKLKENQSSNRDTLSYIMNPVPPVRHKHIVNLMNVANTPPKNGVGPAQRSNLDKRSKSAVNPAIPCNPRLVNCQNTELITKIPRESQKKTIDLDIVPTKTTRQQSAQNRNTKDLTPKTFPAPFSRHRSRENRPNTNSVFQLHQTQTRRCIDPSIAPRPRYEYYEMRKIKEMRYNTVSSPRPRNPSPVIQPNGQQFWRCFATTNLKTTKNKKEEHHEHETKALPMLFDKELVDIIGEKNDMMMRVLYKSSSKEEFPSVMNLMPLPGDRGKDTRTSRKNLAWK